MMAPCPTSPIKLFQKEPDVGSVEKMLLSSIQTHPAFFPRW
jgi:hypothetical protein